MLDKILYPVEDYNGVKVINFNQSRPEKAKNLIKDLLYDFNTAVFELFGIVEDEEDEDEEDEDIVYEEYTSFDEEDNIISFEDYVSPKKH